MAISLPSVETSALAAESSAFLRWLRNTGIAMAARMPMMIMTTRSSIRVKPWSFSCMDLRMRAIIAELLKSSANAVDVQLSPAAGPVQNYSRKIVRWCPGLKREFQFDADSPERRTVILCRASTDKTQSRREDRRRCVGRRGGPVPRPVPATYSMRLKIPKIGMYIAMTMLPMIAPMTTIMIGSMRLVSWSVVASTSSS